MESGWKPNSSASSSKSPLVGSDTSAHTTLRSTPQRSLSSSAGKSCVNSFASLSRHVVVITPLSFLLYVSAPSSILGRQDLGAKKIQHRRRDAVRPSKSTSWFTRFAKWTARASGRPATFVLAAGIVIVWGLTGPLFGFSNTWQLVINTGTTIVTFLMVFLIQNTQNRDARAMHLKLDELIRALKGARNQLVNLEEMSDEELDQLQKEFQRVCGSRRNTKTPAEPEHGAKQSRHHQPEVPAHAPVTIPPSGPGR